LSYGKAREMIGLELPNAAIVQRSAGERRR
jgi:hypothetical protein